MEYDKKNHTIYYQDEYNDDFGEIGLNRPKINEKYKYIRHGFFNVTFSWILYYLIAIPILWCVGKIACGIKVKNRKKLKSIRHKGYFVYGNHTHWLDAFTVSVFVCRPKRVNILGYADALGIPLVRKIVKSLGLIPVGDDVSTAIKMTKAINHYINKKETIAIFPEAHVWPYYNGVRHFVSTSFRYPAKLNTPIVPICTIYRHVWYSKRPRMTIYVGDPIYPRSEYDSHQNSEYLANETYKYFVKIHNEHQSVEFIKYIKK